MLRKSYCIKLLVLISNFLSPSFGQDYVLRTVSVVFRHGDRTPEKIYAKDPYGPKDFFPVPLGGLLNIGKDREYELGRYLRRIYDKFLGDLYIPSEVYARTTNFDRTQMSLLLVLAALYPPKDPQRWRSDLNWQPIPVISTPKREDLLLHPSMCPAWKDELDRVLETEEYQKELAPFRDFMKKLSKYTGEKIVTAHKIINIYHALTAESAMNLELPKWSRPYFPRGEIIEGALFEYKTQNYNNLLRRLNGGTILRKVYDDMYAVSKGKPLQKILLYSAHEVTVAAVLFALNVWRPIIPEYSSAVILELWQRKNKFYVRIVYYRGIPQIAEPRTIPGCDEYCPLKDFEKILRSVMPENYEKECVVRGHAASQSASRSSIFTN